jgi:hypothetical protein
VIHIFTKPWPNPYSRSASRAGISQSRRGAALGELKCGPYDEAIVIDMIIDRI